MIVLRHYALFSLACGLDLSGRLAHKDSTQASGMTLGALLWEVRVLRVSLLESQVQQWHYLWVN